MKAEHINPFVESTANVFGTMLNCELTRGAIQLKQSSQPLYEISGIIGLTGLAAGTVVLSLPRETAFAATQTMLMLDAPPTEINSDVTDAIGELANMVAGAAKAKLEALHMSVTVPTVVVGQAQIDFPSRMSPILIPFTSPFGPLSVEVGLVEQGS